MRHVSRIHRVALDWLFDRINLERLRSKSNMFTPTTNSRTYWQREVSQEMNGITFCVCSMSWVSRCIFAAISRNFLSLSQDRERTVSGAMSKRGQNTISNDDSPTAKARPINPVMHSLGKEEISSQSSGSLVNRLNEDGRKRVGQAPGNWMPYDSQSKSEIPKWVDKRRFFVGFPQANRLEKVGLASGNWRRRIKPKQKVKRNPQAQGNLLLLHQRSGTWNTQTIKTWVRSFKIWKRSWECLQSTQHSQWTHTKPMYWHGDCFKLLRCKPQSTLSLISSWIRISTRTRNSRIFWVYSTWLKIW